MMMRRTGAFVLRCVKIFLVFSLFTVVFYFALMWFGKQQEQDDIDDNAVEVFATENDAQNFNAFERLMLYYLSGE